MKNLSFGQILLLIVFILVPLIKFVMERVRRRLEDHMPEEESVEQMRREAQVLPAPLPMPRAFRNPLFHEAQVPNVAAPILRQRFSRRSLFESRRDVRRGIIIMTLLGPRRTFNLLD